MCIRDSEKAVHGDGIVYKAPAIILATGRKPIALDVPTECDQMHFCAICDGAPYKGKRVLVVGGGNSAFDEGLYLSLIHICVGGEVIAVGQKLKMAGAAIHVHDIMIALAEGAGEGNALGLGLALLGRQKAL